MTNARHRCVTPDKLMDLQVGFDFDTRVWNVITRTQIHSNTAHHITTRHGMDQHQQTTGTASTAEPHQFLSQTTLPSGPGYVLLLVAVSPTPMQCDNGRDVLQVAPPKLNPLRRNAKTKTKNKKKASIRQVGIPPVMQDVGLICVSAGNWYVGRTTTAMPKGSRQQNQARRVIGPYATACCRRQACRLMPS